MAIDFDNVLDEVVGYGLYQAVIYVLCSIVLGCMAGIMVSQQAFIMDTTLNHSCRAPALEKAFGLDPKNPGPDWEKFRQMAVPKNDKGKYEPCKMYDVNWDEYLEGKTLDEALANATKDQKDWKVKEVKEGCPDGVIFSKDFFEMNLVMERGAVCGKDKIFGLPAHTASNNAFYIGSAIGTPTVGFLSDTFGRRKTLIPLMLYALLVSVAQIFVTTSIHWTVVRFFHGLSFSGVYQIPFTIAFEIMPKKWRNMAGMGALIIFSVLFGGYGVLAMVFNHWKRLSYSHIGIIVWLLVLILVIVPESPRWLVAQGKIDRAEKIVQRMAKVNGVKLEQNYLPSKDTSAEAPVAAKGTPKDLFITNPNIRTKYIFAVICWICNASIYTGLAFFSVALPVGNKGMNWFYANLADIPSFFVLLILMRFIGRKPIMILSTFLGGVTVFSAIFTPEGKDWILLILTILGKFTSASAYGVLYLFVGELFPTPLLAQAFAFGSAFSAIGMIAFPYINELQKIVSWLPLCVFGVLFITGGVCTFFLPETWKKNILATIQECEAIPPLWNPKKWFLG